MPVWLTWAVSCSVMTQWSGPRLRSTVKMPVITPLCWRFSHQRWRKLDKKLALSLDICWIPSQSFVTLFLFSANGLLGNESRINGGRGRTWTGIQFIKSYPSRPKGLVGGRLWSPGWGGLEVRTWYFELSLTCVWGGAPAKRRWGTSSGTAGSQTAGPTRTAWTSTLQRGTLQWTITVTACITQFVKLRCD